MEATVAFEAISQSPESIAYKRGDVSVRLEGWLAGLYRGMIGWYGKEEATERFWWYFHKKSGKHSPVIAAQPERAKSIIEGDYITEWKM